MLEIIGDKDLVDKYYLNQIGYDNDHARNLTNAFTYLHYLIKNDISHSSLIEYVVKYKEKMREEFYKLECLWDALLANIR